MNEPALPSKGVFERYDWAALLCLLMGPLLEVVMLGVAMAAHMFPDMVAAHHAAVWLVPKVTLAFPWIAILLGLFALIGSKRGQRVRICWMAGFGLLAAVYYLAFSRVIVD